MLQRAARGLLEHEACLKRRGVGEPRQFVESRAVGAPREQARSRILHRPVMQLSLNGEARQRAGGGRLEHESVDSQVIDIDGRQMRLAAAAARGGRERPAKHIEAADLEALEVQMPGEEREGRPAQRDALGAHPYSMRVAQLEPGDLDAGGKTAAESGDAHAPGGEPGSLALEQAASGAGIARDDQRADGKQHQQQQAGEAQARDACRPAHQNACPRPM